MTEDLGSSVPEPIAQAAPGGFAAAEPLVDVVRRIVREELRPIHLLLEEIRDRSSTTPRLAARHNSDRDDSGKDERV
jgi:hypothetical protein